LCTAACEISIFENSVADHQQIPYSAGPLFSISLHRQTENEFLSTHFSLWGIDKSYRGLIQVNRWGVGALECTYLLKIASRRGNFELAHFIDAESIISSSTTSAFSSLLVLGARSGPPSSYFD
jgi:hypothetical protein